jgi:hypothetical protein
MDASFIAMLDLARETAGVPFKITSDFRVGDAKCHGRGKAVDIACTDSRSRYAILAALVGVGFKRIGIYDRHIHVDFCTEAEGFPRPRCWWGESR